MRSPSTDLRAGREEYERPNKLTSNRVLAKPRCFCAKVSIAPCQQPRVWSELSFPHFFIENIINENGDFPMPFHVYIQRNMGNPLFLKG